MNPKPIIQNTLFYGDNLPILREYLSDESVDLIYLDPPFNSNRSYNVLLLKSPVAFSLRATIVIFALLVILPQRPISLPPATDGGLAFALITC